MVLNRRTALKMGLGAGVVVAGIPVTQSVLWNGKDFTRPGYEPALPNAPEGHAAWQNWSGIHKATPKEMFVPADVTTLAEKIGSWGGRVRPVGSGHSFTPLVPSQDMIVDISRLSGLIHYDAVAKTATFGAGTRLRQAAQLAAKVGLAFPNLPDIDVQTLAGSFSTGTHGTGRTLAAIHDGIVSFRMITATGSILDVSRNSHPELFAAGKVSLGSLGVITDYTLRMVDNYALTRSITLARTDDIIANMLDLSKAHRNFEFYALPGSEYSAVIIHDSYDGKLEGRPPSKDEDFLATLKDLRDTLGWWPWLRRKAFGAYVSAFVPDDGPMEEATDEYWRLLTTSRPTKFNETEYHIPEANAQAAIAEISAIMNSRPDAYFPVECRFTGQDDAWLSPFNDGVRCSIAVHTPAEEPYKVLADVIEPVLQRHGGRPHWGKMHSLGQHELMEMYPAFGDFKALRKEMDPSGKFLNAHLAKLFGENLA